MEVLRIASGKFRDRIHPGFFQEVGVFFAHAFDTKEVGEIDPFQNEALGDSSLVRYRFASCGRGACLK